MSLLFFVSQGGEWVGVTPLPRAENRGLNPVMAIPQALTCPQCVFAMEKNKHCVLQLGLREELTSRLQTPHCPLLLFPPSPVGTSLPVGPVPFPPQTSSSLSLLPQCWVTNPRFQAQMPRW